MDEWPLSISPHQLYARLGTALVPVLIDVRCQDAFAADNTLVIGAFHRPDDQVRQWAKDLRPGRLPGAEDLLGNELPAHARPSVARALGVGSVWLVLWLAPVAAILAALGQANGATA